MTVINPLGEKEINNFATVSAAQTNPQGGDVFTYDAAGALIRTVHTDYVGTISSQPSGEVYDFTLPQKITTTLNDASPPITSSISYIYQPFTLFTPTSRSTVIDNPIEIDTTDYDGTVRRTVTQKWKDGLSVR